MVLDTQRQIFDEGKYLSETSAYRSVEEALIREKEQYELDHRNVQTMLEGALREKNDKHASEIQRKILKLDEQATRYRAKSTSCSRGTEPSSHRRCDTGQIKEP